MESDPGGKGALNSADWEAKQWAGAVLEKRLLRVTAKLVVFRNNSLYIFFSAGNHSAYYHFFLAKVHMWCSVAPKECYQIKPTEKLMYWDSGW